jgi:hypothetical protein
MILEFVVLPRSGSRANHIRSSPKAEHANIAKNNHQSFRRSMSSMRAGLQQRHARARLLQQPKCPWTCAHGQCLAVSVFRQNHSRSARKNFRASETDSEQARAVTSHSTFAVKKIVGRLENVHRSARLTLFPRLASMSYGHAPIPHDRGSQQISKLTFLSVTLISERCRYEAI